MSAACASAPQPIIAADNIPTKAIRIITSLAVIDGLLKYKGRGHSSFE